MARTTHCTAQPHAASRPSPSRAPRASCRRRTPAHALLAWGCSIIAITACACGGRAPRTPADGAAVVRTAGALREILHEGDLHARVSLDTLLPDPHLYALGALADLRGEITVLAGLAFIATPQGAGGSATTIPERPDQGAALLVSSRVGSWRPVAVEEDIPFSRLGDTVRRLASTHGVDPAEPFPFLIEGPVADLEFHVIDGARLAPGPSSHQAHRDAAVRHRLDRESRAILIGFYSERHQGVFTHAGSRTHVHVVAGLPPLSGHVDQVTVRAGAILRVPGQPQPGDPVEAPGAGLLSPALGRR